MPASNFALPAIRGLAARLALAAACGLTACMDAASTTGSQPAGATSGAQALQEKKASLPGVPDGCTREWSSAKRDSVLYCPDVLPPSPR